MRSGDKQDKNKKKKRAPYGSGSIKKMYNGKFQYRFPYKDVYGKRRIRAVTADTVEECLERADDFRKKMDLLKGKFDIDATIVDIIRWKVDNDYAKNYTHEAGYGRNLDTIKLIEKSGLASIPIVDVTPAQVDYYLRSITHYSNNMIRRVYSMIRMAFRIAFDFRLIECNFMTRDDLRCPRSDKPTKKVRGFTEEEQERFLKALLEHKVRDGTNSYKLQLQIALYSGMRMGEINALKPKDIHFKEGYIHVCRTITMGINYEPLIREGTKTDAGVRDVPISSMLEPVLRTALARRKRNPEGLIFYDHRKHKVITTTQVNSTFKRICEKAGLEHTGQHALRHTFATRCIEAGVPPIVLKNWLGHTNIHITLDTYADVFARMNLGAVSLLEQHMLELMPKELPELDLTEDD